MPFWGKAVAKAPQSHPKGTLKVSTFRPAPLLYKLTVVSLSPKTTTPMKDLHQYFYQIFLEQGLSQQVATFLNMLALFICLLLILWLSDIITRKVLVRAFHTFAR